ncbi:MAG: GNAT family N-acetyltransferase, partial [Chloroflexi bacterium]|nr:GNAT family N-acetyltransferase [Chloroflexota bacterium]
MPSPHSPIAPHTSKAELQNSLSKNNQVSCMKLQYTLETFDSLSSEWTKLQEESPTVPIFSSLDWSSTWWQHFNPAAKLHLATIKNQGNVIGIAPLMVKKNVASFVGGIDVCDYLDFVVSSENAEAFFQILLDNLRKEGVRKLSLAPLRPDSTAIATMPTVARQLGWQVACSQIDVTVELDLPGTWEEYLQLLVSKQRHELKRKLRRLEEEGEITYRTAAEASPQDIDIFLKLFRESREDKAEFMMPARESFFRAIAKTMAKRKTFRLGLLEVDSKPAAATIAFEYKNNVYLYNSGYDPQYAWL